MVAPSDDTTKLAYAVHYAVMHQLGGIISNSYGHAEAGTGPSVARSFNTVMQQAAAAGIADGVHRRRPGHDQQVEPARHHDRPGQHHGRCGALYAAGAAWACTAGRLRWLAETDDDGFYDLGFGADFSLTATPGWDTATDFGEPEVMAFIKAAK